MHTYFVLEKFDISQKSNPLRGNKSKSASLAEKKDYVAKKFSWEGDNCKSFCAEKSLKVGLKENLFDTFNQFHLSGCEECAA